MTTRIKLERVRVYYPACGHTDNILMWPEGLSEAPDGVFRIIDENLPCYDCAHPKASEK